MNIVTKSELQKNIGKLGEKSYILVNRGIPESIIVPYFEGSEDWVADYLEEYEIRKNKKKLSAEMKKSKESGLSDIVVE